MLLWNCAVKTYNCFSVPSFFISLCLSCYFIFILLFAATASNTFEYNICIYGDSHGNDTVIANKKSKIRTLKSMCITFTENRVPMLDIIYCILCILYVMRMLDFISK